MKLSVKYEEGIRSGSINYYAIQGSAVKIEDMEILNDKITSVWLSSAVTLLNFGSRVLD